MVLETLDIDMPKNEILHHMPKSMSKWIKDLKVRPETIKLQEKFFGSGSSSNSNKTTNKQMGLYQTKKLSY